VAAANARLARLAPQIQSTNPATDPDADGPPTVVATQRPAEIVNYRSMGTTPALMALLLTIAATSALALTLIASVRSLRRDFAILQSLGFTRRQIGAAVAWQSTFTVALGVLIGVPVGIVAGRWLWDTFAHHINVPAEPTISVALILVVVAAALLLANIIAVVPRLIAAKTQTLSLLRAE
jgi:ABC-type lipoprotein release transport system permease subunit